MKTDLLDLRNCDCMDLMGEFDDGHFDVAVVDPPYGIGWCWKNPGRLAKSSHEKKPWNDKRPDEKYFKELFRVSKHQIIWGGNYYADLLPAVRGWLVWDKVNYKSVYSQVEMAWTSFDMVAQIFAFMWNGMQQGRPDNGRIMQGNKKLNEERIHPTQKPVQLYRWMASKFLQKLQDELDRPLRVLDTNLGSGSSAIAYHEYGFHTTGSDIDPEYFSDMVTRVAAAIKQTDLHNQIREVQSQTQGKLFGHEE